MGYRYVILRIVGYYFDLIRCEQGYFQFLAFYLSSTFSQHFPSLPCADIADESNGWFYGTAYHFDDTTNMVHVMVPDKHNPSFDGHVM